MFKKFKLKWLIHPIAVLILAQICWGLLIFVWIRWYLLRSYEINNLIKKIPLHTSISGQWVILLQGCILMAFILIGLYLIFLSQQRLLRLARMQDAILSSVSHELKTPLASIKLYIETLLLRSVTVEEKNKFLHKSLSEAERLQKLIDTILISATLQANKAANLYRVNLAKIMLSSFHKAQERFAYVRSLELKYDESINFEDDFFILGNSAHLTTLFDNLIDNAIKYTQVYGLINVEIQHKRELIVVCVKDNGCGIEKNQLKKIFKKFYRVHNKGQASIKGSGLGLSVCHSIVQEHKGKIFARSDGLNKGSIFYVEFQRLSPHS